MHLPEMLRWRSIHDNDLAASGQEVATYAELRARVAEAYSGGGDGDDDGETELIDHYYCAVVHHDEASWEEQKPDWVLDIELDLNDAAQRDAAIWRDPDRPANAGIVVFPSPPRMINRALRPPAPTAETLQRVTPYFHVEMYAPHVHADLFREYLALAEQENEELELRTRMITPGGVNEYEEDVSCLFLALREGKMIGYADCKMLLPLSGDRADPYHVELLFGTEDANPQALFEIVGLSALRAHGGYQVALVLLYHAFFFLRSQRPRIPITHLVSHAASIVTKHYLCSQFGFSYTGKNYFMNDDFIDTIEPALRGAWCTLLKVAARFLLEYFRATDYERTDPLIDTALRVYQLALWFRLLDSKSLRLILLLHTDRRLPARVHRFLDGIVNRHLQLLSEPAQLGNALHETYLYFASKHHQFGIASPQIKSSGKLDTKYKWAADFGYDELLRVTLAVGEAMQRLDTLFNVDFAISTRRLIDFIGADLEKRENYTIGATQLDEMENVLVQAEEIDATPMLREAIEQKTRHHEAMDAARDTLFKHRYGLLDAAMNTVAPFAVMERTLHKTATLYEAGKTKNFVPLATTQEKAVPKLPSVLYPNDETELVALIRTVKAILYADDPPPKEGTVLYQGMRLAELREYDDNLFIKLQVIRQQFDVFGKTG